MTCNPKTPEELQAMVDAIDHKDLRDTFNKVGQEFGILPSSEEELQRLSDAEFQELALRVYAEQQRRTGSDFPYG